MIEKRARRNSGSFFVLISRLFFLRPHIEADLFVKIKHFACKRVNQQISDDAAECQISYAVPFADMPINTFQGGLIAVF